MKRRSGEVWLGLLELWVGEVTRGEGERRLWRGREGRLG